jgi:uncharacterized protein (TIGR04168 family)
MLAHNGPAGLGDQKHDPVGKDFVHEGGDYGDDDARAAIDRIVTIPGRRLSLFVYGHMHQRLKEGGLRRMVEVDADHGLVFLNGAVVPRWVTKGAGDPWPEGRSERGLVGGVLRHFSVAEGRSNVGVIMA